MSSNRRSLLNYMRAAKLSQSYHFNVLMLGLILSTILLYYGARQLNEANVAAASLPETSLSFILQEKVTSLAQLFFGVFVIFVLATAGYIVMFSQRVGGPIIFICMYIDELKKGNYSPPRALRKGDELGLIIEKLTELAAVLEAQKKK